MSDDTGVSDSFDFDGDDNNFDGLPEDPGAIDVCLKVRAQHAQNAGVQATALSRAHGRCQLRMHAMCCPSHQARQSTLRIAG